MQLCKSDSWKEIQYFITSEEQFQAFYSFSKRESFLEFFSDRSNWKHNIMTSCYGVSARTVEKEFRKLLKEKFSFSDEELSLIPRILKNVTLYALPRSEFRGITKYLKFCKCICNIAKFLQIKNSNGAFSLEYRKRMMIVSKPSHLREDYKYAAGSPLQIQITRNTPDWLKMGNSLPSNSIQGLDSCTLFNILDLAKQLDLKLIPQHDSIGANFIYFFIVKKVLSYGYLNLNTKLTLDSIFENVLILSDESSRGYSFSKPMRENLTKKERDFVVQNSDQCYKLYQFILKENQDFDFQTNFINSYFVK